MNFATNAAITEDVSIHVRDREPISCGKQPAVVQGDDVQHAKGQAVAAPTGPLKEQLSVRNDTIDPIVPGGEDEIPRRDTIQSVS